MPRMRTPVRIASSTSCSGEKVPSDAVVCECKSIIWDQTQVLERNPYPVDPVLGRFEGGMNRQLGRFRGLVWVRDAGEVFDLAGQSFLVQTFHVAPDQHLQRTLDEDFDEVRNAGANAAAHVTIGRD